MRLLKTDLYKFQRIGARRALKKNGFALFMEQGTGKTITALKVIAVRWRRNGLRFAIVLGPKNALGIWRRQIARHLAIPHRVYTGVAGITDAEKIKPGTDDMIFLIVNYEAAWRQIKRLLKLAKKWSDIHAVFDEGHRMRHRNSRQSKASAKLGAASEWRLNLTGTPIGKDEQDLWAQFRATNPEILGDRWTAFDKRYLRRAGFMGHKRKFRGRARERMLSKLAPVTYRVEARKALGLPKETHQELVFSLTGEAKRAYREMEERFLYRFGDFEAATPLAITNMLRLQQLTGGHLGGVDGRVLRLEQDKLLTLADWMKDYPRDEKLVIFAKFTDEIDLIAELMEELGRSYVIRDGRTKPAHLDDWMLFQDEKDPSTYIAQIGAGGVGIELFASRVGVIYSNTLNYIDYDQALKRIMRNGQTRPVLWVHLIAENTIDEAFGPDLDGKRNVADVAMTFLKERRLTMATEKKAVKKTAKTATKRTPPKIEKPEHGIEALGKAIGEKNGALVRARLRNAEGVEQYKKGRLWDFGSKGNLDKVAKQLTKPKKSADKE